MASGTNVTYYMHLFHWCCVAEMPGNILSLSHSVPSKHSTECLDLLPLLQFHLTVLLVMCVWLMEGMRWKEEWRCAEMRCGEQSLSPPGIILMLKSLAVSWDTLQGVSAYSYEYCSIAVARCLFPITAIPLV